MGQTRRSFARLVVFVLLGIPVCHAATFTAGDLYLITTAHPDPLIETGILRIVPETGAVTTLGEVPLYAGNFSYDPYRDRLVGSQGAGTGGLMLVDVTGAVTPLSDTIPTPFLVEPRGDGILYVFYSASGNFGYVDAADNLYDLLDEGGTEPYSLGNDADPTELHYDYTTNSLIVFDGTNSDISECPDQTRSCALQIRLTADGTRVAGTVTAMQSDVSSTGEIVVGASQGPGNSVLWVVDTNSNDQEPRMQILDPASMISTPYASNGPYTGAAATNAGAFSGRLGQAVILDTFGNWLRAFGYGTVGSGAVIAEGVSDPGGAGETARLIEIRPSPFLTGVAGAAPTRGMLLPPFPNPFNAMTELRVRLAAPARVTLSIHDAAGRRVRALKEATLTQGEHVFSWDGTDAGGRILPSGIYFAQLALGRAREVQRLVLLK